MILILIKIVRLYDKYSYLFNKSHQNSMKLIKTSLQVTFLIQLYCKSLQTAER